MDQHQFSVVTLNCWGVFTPGAVEKRHERFTAIGEALASGKHDIVFLEEVWTDADFKKLCHALSASYTYNNYFHSNLIGSGVCLFSKYEILDTFFYPYPANGYPYRLQHGDWFGGKGVGLAKLKLTNNFIVNTYVTHMHAQYRPTDNEDEYLSHRVSQAFQLSQFIRFTSGDCDAVILAGDFNVRFGSLAYRVITKSAGLRDAWLDQRVKPKDPEVTGCTSDRPGNSFMTPSWVQYFPHGERLDYIMFKNNAGIDMECVDCALTLGKIPDKEFNYSDHEAVEANFIIKKSPTNEGVALCDTTRQEVCKEVMSEMDKGLDQVYRDRLWMGAAMFLFVALAIASPQFFSVGSLLHLLIVFTSGLGFFISLWNLVVVKTAERRALTNTKQECWFIIGQCKSNNYTQ